MAGFQFTLLTHVKLDVNISRNFLVLSKPQWSQWYCL